MIYFTRNVHCGNGDGFQWSARDVSVAQRPRVTHESDLAICGWVHAQEVLEVCHITTANIQYTNVQYMYMYRLVLFVFF